MIRFGYVVGGFADLAENQGERFKPSGMVDVELDDCSKDEEEVVDESITAFHKHNVGDLAWAWGFIGAQQANDLPDSCS